MNDPKPFTTLVVEKESQFLPQYIIQVQRTLPSRQYTLSSIPIMETELLLPRYYYLAYTQETLLLTTLNSKEWPRVDRHLLSCLPPAEAFIIACRRGLIKIMQPVVSQLLTQDLKKEVGGYLLLQEASRAGSLDLVRKMIEAGASVNQQRSKDKCTALFVAAQEGHLAVVEELLRNGADCNLPSLDIGATPLTVAAEKGKRIYARCISSSHLTTYPPQDMSK